MLQDRFISDETKRYLQEQRLLNKRCMAKEVWKRRHEECPIPQKVDGFKKKVTWMEWFGIKFGEPLMDYVERVRKEKNDGVQAQPGSNGS